MRGCVVHNRLSACARDLSVLSKANPRWPCPQRLGLLLRIARARAAAPQSWHSAYGYVRYSWWDRCTVRTMHILRIPFPPAAGRTKRKARARRECEVCGKKTHTFHGQRGLVYSAARRKDATDRRKKLFPCRFLRETGARTLLLATVQGKRKANPSCLRPGAVELHRAATLTPFPGAAI